MHRSCLAYVLAADALLAIALVVPVHAVELCPNKCAENRPAYTHECLSETVTVNCTWTYQGQACSTQHSCAKCGVNVPTLKKPCEEALSVDCKCCFNSEWRGYCKLPTCQASGPCNSPTLKCNFNAGQTWECGSVDDVVVVYGSCDDCSGHQNCQTCP